MEAMQADLAARPVTGRILIVDDEEVVHLTLKRFLKREAYSIDDAYGAAEALEKLSRESFDLVISDIRMPGQSGIDLLREIRTRGIAVEVMMLTGYASTDSATQAAELGAIGYITKPIENLTEFRSQVAGSLRRKIEALAAEGGRRVRILVVDDEEIAHATLRRLFEADGFEIRSVYTGKDALEALAAGYDLAVIDIRLPDMGGIELLREIRARKLPVETLILTGYPSEETRTEAGQKGVCGYFLKPLDCPEEFKQRVREGIQRGQGMKGAQSL